MKFTFKSEQYGTTVEIHFEGIQLENINEMFKQFLKGSGFYLVDEDDMYSKQENDDTSEECVHESDTKQWIGLTDDEIESIVDLNTTDDAGYEIFCDGHSIASAVIDKLKERNT